ncbi:MAG TPA: pitrilysin family protein [Fimbriiglobus sp.]|nr:pitrilysin family protein [Fimbriiglobus sp.]
MPIPRRWAVVLALAALGCASRLTAADVALVKAASAQFDHLRTETLPNGLRVYLLPVPGAPTVTTMVAYKVGSADEDQDQTGLAHYLEHLMFKGTDKLMPGDIDRITQRNGGRNNAYTTEDMTVYHFDFAADRWTKALGIEADRMRNVRIDPKHEFQQEKGAVVAELKGNEDRPWTLEYEAILPLLFPPKSPYAHPVIGEERHVRAATAEVIKRYYDKWYHPNNAALIIAGGFDPDEAMALVTKLFGPIPRTDLPDRKAAPHAHERTTQERTEFPSKFDVARMLAGFNTVKSGNPDEYVLDLIEDILAGGKTSRLYRRLVEQERLVNAVGAGNSSGRYPGWFAVNVEMLQGKDRARAEAIVFEELEKLAKEPVTDAELRRVKRAALASFIFSRESVHNLADLVSRTVLLHDVDYLKTYLDRLNAVTAADIRRVVAKYLTKPKSAVVWSVPAEGKGGSSLGPRPSRPLLLRRSGAIDDTSAHLPGEARAAGTAAVPGESTFSLKDAKRVVLPNGLTLVMLENHRLPIVVAEAYLRGVRLREPADKSGVAALMGNMLDEGTATHTGTEIATLIEDAGGSLSLDSSGGSVRVLTPDTDLGLSLLFDSLIHPSFPAKELERKRDQLLTEIAERERRPQTRARQLFNKLVYGDHPFGRPTAGKKEVVEKLTRDDLKAFHASAFSPDRAIVVVVGDFAAAEMAESVKKLTAGWKKSDAGRLKVILPPWSNGPVVKIVPDKTAAQTHVFIGHLGITRDNPDYYTLLVMDNVLGTGPGFTDRLSANLRDRQGLAYTVTAQITGSAGEQPGTFTGYIGTFPDKFNVAKEGFLAEIGKIRNEPPTPREVEDAKKYLLGSLPFKLTTSARVASQLLAAERFGLGFDFLEEYRRKVAAVTPADVQAAARKYLHPNRLVIVAVGPIGADGKPLKSPTK